MNERPRFFDDLAGMAGGAMSALTGLKDEAEAMARARMDEAIRKLDLVRREQLDAVAEIATRAREGQLAAEARLSALEAKLASMEVRTPAAIPLPDRTPDRTPGGAIDTPPFTPTD